MKLSEFMKVANWPMVIYLSFVHILGVYALWFITNISWQTLLWTFGAYVFSGVGITGGAHRLWAHRSYSAHWFVRALLMVGNSMANQGTIFHWCRDHRVHHKYSETSKDPHNALRGFFFAHCGWLMVKKERAVIEAGQQIPLDDLLADPIVTFQMKVNPWWNLYWCFVAPALGPWYFWGEPFLRAFLVCGCLRYVLVLHATWMVNSFAHKIGYRPYDKTINPRENFWVAFYALGEGWHNWHHKYPYEYATSEFGILQQLNPTKLIIDFFALFGLVWDRQRALGAWRIAKAQLEKQSKNVVDTATHLQGSTATY